MIAIALSGVQVDNSALGRSFTHVYTVLSLSGLKSPSLEGL